MQPPHLVFLVILNEYTKNGSRKHSPAKKFSACYLGDKYEHVTPSKSSHKHQYTIQVLCLLFLKN